MIVAPDEALTLPVDQLALRLLAWLGKTVNGLHNRRNVLLGARQSYDHNGCHDNGPVVRALGEAFDWLCYRGLLAPDPEQDNFFYITSRGREVLQSSTGAAALRATDRLAVDLHPRIAARARAQFLMGEHELAAFTAFREVEIRVRELANAGNDAIGVPLMRSAFKPSGGALTDPGPESGEQEAMSALFVGAMGVFKNPTSHRRVEYADPTVASEVVLLGDLLLRMLDDVERVARPLNCGGCRGRARNCARTSSMFWSRAMCAVPQHERERYAAELAAATGAAAASPTRSGAAAGGDLPSSSTARTLGLSSRLTRRSSPRRRLRLGRR